VPLFGRPDVSRLKARGDVKGLIRALRYREYAGVPMDAAAALGRLADPQAVEPLIAALEDGIWCVRDAAVKALGQIGDERAMEPLIAALSSNNLGLRKAAAWSLGQIGDVGAVEPLVPLLKEWRGHVCQAAAEALDRLGWQPDTREKEAAFWAAMGAWDLCVEIGAPAVQPLLAALEDQDWQVRKAAAEALGKIGDGRAVAPLVAALHEGGVVSIAATEALGKIGAPAVGPLLAAFRGREWRTPQATDQVLRQLGAAAVEPLVAALGDRDGHVRCSAAQRLGATRSARAVAPLIAALKDQDWRVCEAAIEALGQIGDERAVEPLITCLCDPDSARCKAAAARVLGRRGDPRVVGPLIATLKDADGSVRRAAAEALGQIGDAPAVEPLVAALKDRDGHVRRAAAESLDRLGWKPASSGNEVAHSVAKEDWDKCVQIGAPAVEPLLAILKDTDWTPLWAAAAESLGKIGDPRAVEPLVAILVGEKGEFGHRCAAAQALATLYCRGNLDEQSKQSILALRDILNKSHIDQSPPSDCHADVGVRGRDRL